MDIKLQCGRLLSQGVNNEQSVCNRLLLHVKQLCHICVHVILGVIFTVIQLLKTTKRAEGRSKQDPSTMESTGLTAVTLRWPCITQLHCCIVSLFSLQTVKLKETPPLFLHCVWSHCSFAKQMAAIRTKPK